MLRARRQGSGLGAALALAVEVSGGEGCNTKNLTSRGPVPSGKAGCEANLAQQVLNESLLLKELFKFPKNHLFQKLSWINTHLFVLLLSLEAGFQSFFSVLETWQKQGMFSVLGVGVKGAFQKRN